MPRWWPHEDARGQPGIGTRRRHGSSRADKSSGSRGMRQRRTPRHQDVGLATSRDRCRAPPGTRGAFLGDGAKDSSHGRSTVAPLSSRQSNGLAGGDARRRTTGPTWSQRTTVRVSRAPTHPDSGNYSEACSTPERLGLRMGGALAGHRLVPGRFVIRATHERGVGVPSSRSLSTASHEALPGYIERPTFSAVLTATPHDQCLTGGWPRSPSC